MPHKICCKNIVHISFFFEFWFGLCFEFWFCFEFDIISCCCVQVLNIHILVKCWHGTISLKGINTWVYAKSWPNLNSFRLWGGHLKLKKYTDKEPHASSDLYQIPFSLFLKPISNSIPSLSLRSSQFISFLVSIQSGPHRSSTFVTGLWTPWKKVRSISHTLTHLLL